VQQFDYLKVKSIGDALQTTKQNRKFVAGGTTLIDLMKLEVEAPEVLIDVTQLPWKKIEKQKNGDYKIGALVTNTDLAQDKGVKDAFPVLSQALLSGASTQLRNKATTGGNLLQRTRCVYFRDPSKACNKREAGSGCSAIDGHNRNLAILGTSEKCIATNPSDMNVALAALEATVQLTNGKDERSVPLQDFHLLPGTTPHLESVVQADELISGITIPALSKGTKTGYLKLRDRASYEFALASAAVVAKVSNGKIERIRIAMGGIGTKPWRVVSAEKMLEGQAPTEANFQKAADEFLKGAKSYSENGFKVKLARLCLIQTLLTTTAG
jgi:xanthine dehydrogenase YagS FAD-binding subunit